MFSNTVFATNSTGTTLMNTSLVDVQKGKSTRRVIIDASHTIELKIANAPSTENAPAGSRRSLVRVDLNHVVTDATGKAATLTTSAYIVLVQPVAETEYNSLRHVLNTLVLFIINGDDNTKTLASTTPGAYGALLSTMADISNAGVPLARVIAGEL